MKSNDANCGWMIDDFPVNYREKANSEIKKMSQRETADLVIDIVKRKIVYHTGICEWYKKSGDIMMMVDAESINPIIIAALDEIKLKNYPYTLVVNIKSFIRNLLVIENFEDSRTLLPLKNGVLNVQTSQLEKYDNYNFCWQLPYSYNPKAKCPAILRYLVTSTNRDRGLIDFLLAWMRLLITGEYTVQKYLELFGEGGTGKSTFFELCTSLVGEDNQVVTDLKSLENNRFETSNLKDKRLTLIPDSSNYFGEVSILKSMTGGDIIRNEKKYKQAGKGFLYKGLVMISTNEQIQSSDYTSGLSRRKIPVIFNTKVSEKEKLRYENGIMSQMRKELSGLLNLLLGIDVHDALKIVKSPKGSLSKIKLQNELYTNPILGWMNENLVICLQGKHSFIGTGNKKTDSLSQIISKQKNKLYPNYLGWCEEQGKQSVGINRFSALVSDMARSHGINTKKERSSAGVFFTCLRLREASDKHSCLLDKKDSGF